MIALEELVVAALWAVVLWRYPSVRQGRKPRALWCTFCALATALTLRVPRIIATVEGGTGISDLTVLLMHLSGIAAIGFLLTWIAAMVSGDHTRILTPRINLGLTLTVSTALTVLFFSSDRPHGQDPFLAHQATPPLVAVYLWIWFCYLGIAMALASALFLHAFRRSARGLLRAGLGVMSAGCGIGVLYTVFRLLFLIERHRSGAFTSDTATEEIAEAMQFTAILTILVGSTLPAGETLWRRVRTYRRLRRLRPLWSELTTAVPHVVLGAPPTAGDDLLAGDDAPLLLHRRVIEIRDAALALRAHVPPGLYQRALAAAAEAGLTGHDRQALAAAVALRCAARAELGGAAPADAPARDFLQTPDGETEDSWLTRIGAAHRSPAAHALADRLTAAPPLPVGG